MANVATFSRADYEGLDPAAFFDGEHVQLLFKRHAAPEVILWFSVAEAARVANILKATCANALDGKTGTTHADESYTP